MLDLFNIPTPQTANYQEFYGGGTSQDWTKPRGASMVRFMLIGAGGGGVSGSATVGGGGGGSGAVTSWIGPAIFIPDVLRITVGAGGVAGQNGTESVVTYQAKNGTGYILLQALYGSAGSGTTAGGAGGIANTVEYFGASGIFTSTAGQAGTAGSASGAGGNQAASTTTFLSGGAGGAGATANTGGSVTPNYGYTALSTTAAGGTTAAKDGYFITQPILVGCGGAGGSTSQVVGTAGGRGGIGCGGGGAGEDALTGGGKGGDGAVFIWSW
jgi:hypothetical protein